MDTTAQRNAQTDGPKPSGPPGGLGGPGGRSGGGRRRGRDGGGGLAAEHDAVTLDAIRDCLDRYPLNKPTVVAYGPLEKL